MKNHFLAISLLILIFSFTSCGLFVKKANFTETELSWFDVYKVHDTLIFQSVETKKRDTTVIISKDIYHYYEWSISDYKMHIALLKYYNNAQNTDISNEYYMFNLSKRKPTESKNLGLTYLNSIFRLSDVNQKPEECELILTKKNFQKTQRLVYDRPKYSNAVDTNPEVLWWDEKVGIIKYINFNGEVWERINWN
jgi:hypothetical protein